MLQFSKSFVFVIIGCVFVALIIGFPRTCFHTVIRVTSIALVAISISWQVSGLVTQVWQSMRKKKCSTHGKCVLITGCDTGFGHATALHLNRIGFSVFAGCLFPDREGGSRLQRECKYPNKMRVVKFDVRSDSDIKKTYHVINKHVNETGENLYAMVNNAGIAGWSPLEWGTMDHDIDPVVSIDLTAVMKITRTFMPLLRKMPDSRIVFLTSQTSKISIPYLAPYVVAKRGVKSFADVLRSEVDMDPAYYNNMKILNIQPTVYKTGLTEYDTALRNIDKTWDRTSKSVQQAYGREIYDGFKNFVSWNKYFQAIDFIAYRSDLFEVARVIEQMIRIEDPASNIDAMPLYAYYSYKQLVDCLPDESWDFLLTLQGTLLRNFSLSGI